MIAELTAEGTPPEFTVGRVLEAWIRQKIMRDLRVPRSLPVAIHNRAAFVDQMMHVMRDVAAAMTANTEGGIVLQETVDSSEVSKVAERVLGAANIDIATIASVSLVLPVTQRRSLNVPMRFSHRVFQEFFTAKYLLSLSAGERSVPTPVARLMAELR